MILSSGVSGFGHARGFGDWKDSLLDAGKDLLSAGGQAVLTTAAGKLAPKTQTATTSGGGAMQKSAGMSTGAKIALGVAAGVGVYALYKIAKR